MGTGTIPTDDYVEGKVPGITNGVLPADGQVIIVPTTSSYSMMDFLYTGQSVDAYTLFCRMDTYVQVGSGTQKTQYLWTAKDLGQYVRMAGVSFDGGKTWTSSFPVTIPDGVDTIYVKVEYRLRKTDPWIPYEAKDTLTQETQPGVALMVSGSRLYVLNQALTEMNTTITSSMIMNEDKSLDAGSQINLYRYLDTYLENTVDVSEELDRLFPGWTEDGKKVSWIYDLGKGRHILEPADSVAVPDGYHVVATRKFVTEDGKVDYWNGMIYTYLQDLIGVDDEAFTYTRNRAGKQKVLQIPDYVQMVEIPSYDMVTVDELYIPDSVIYIDQTAYSGLYVEDAFYVEDTNPNYKSQDGLLLNKEETEIAGIPSKMEEMDIPASVTSVALTANNQLHRIHLEAHALSDIPELDYSVLSDCTMVVPDNLLFEYISRNKSDLENEDIKVTVTSEADRSYQVKDGALLGEDGQLHKVLNDEGKVFTLPAQASTVEKDAFSQATRVNTFVLPEDADVSLEKDCFANTYLKNIVCSTEEQKEKVTENLKESGNTEISVLLKTRSAEGYTYLSETVDGTETITLLDAPEDVSTFNGEITIDGEKKKVDVIGDMAFANTASLQWVILPEETDMIGYRAFYGCSSLEGIFISNREEIMIGNQAFDDCASLRFIASNAKSAQMQDAYDPLVVWRDGADFSTDVSLFYVTEDASGYGANANVQPYDRFEILSQGKDGSGRILYGGTTGQDGTFLPQSVLRTEIALPEKVVLPQTVTEIEEIAFADAGTDTCFTLNWDALSLEHIGTAAFYHAGISGDVVLGHEDSDPGQVAIESKAFYQADAMQSITVYDTITELGKEVFGECANLSSVEFSAFGGSQTEYGWVKAGIHTFSFNGCDKLERITIRDCEVPDLVTEDGYYGFRFNNDWSREEEAQHIQVVVRKDMIGDYLDAWKYRVSDYAYTGYYETPYLSIWNTWRGNLIDWETWEYPDDATVDAVVWQQLLDDENYLRGLLVAKAVSEPTDFYPYHVDSAGMIVLVGAPTYIETLHLDAETIGLPEGWYIDYIGKDALSGCSNLKEIVIPEDLAGMDADFLNGAGVDGERVTLTFSGENAPALRLSQEGLPYSFGLEDARICLQVLEAEQNFYLMDWIVPMCGYEDLSQLQSAVTWDLMQSDPEAEITDQMVQDEMLSRMLPQENRLRAMMGMEQVTEASDSISAMLLLFM